MKHSFQKKKHSARQQALWWLTSVTKDGRSVNDLLATGKLDNLAPKEQALAKQLLFGSLRYFHQLKAILDKLMEKPLKQKDGDIFAALILGIYQLRYLSIPDHAAISESVELTKAIKKPWATGLVNGVLRNYQRQKISIESILDSALTFRYSHPNWIINQLKEDWPDAYGSILEANNRRAPMTIRVNLQNISATDYVRKLQKASMDFSQHQVAKDALILGTPCNVFNLPGFEQGQVSVQDAAAQLTVDFLNLSSGLKVLDGCAAPGGKTTHILQRYPDTQLTSVEMSSTRIIKIEESLARLKCRSKLICANIIETDKWWDGEQFDRILIDVPCSASGVIRRNPDIKIHRKKLDLSNLVKLQTTILQSVWSLLKPGGQLVYATCSVFKDENERQINAFLENQPAILLNPPENLTSHLAKHTTIGLQILPGEAQMDGFYLCGLEKPK